jgi:hypothetical protein
MSATQEARAAAEIVALLLSEPDLNHDQLLRLVQAHRRLNRLLDQIVPQADDLLPQAGPRMFALVSSQRLPAAGHVSIGGQLSYCRGCGFTFDSTSPLEAAQHRSH